MCIVVQNMEAISLLQDEVAVAVFTAVGKFNILPSMVKNGDSAFPEVYQTVRLQDYCN